MYDGFRVGERYRHTRSSRSHLRRWTSTFFVYWFFCSIHSFDSTHCLHGCGLFFLYFIVVVGGGDNVIIIITTTTSHNVKRLKQSPKIWCALGAQCVEPRTACRSSKNVSKNEYHGPPYDELHFMFIFIPVLFLLLLHFIHSLLLLSFNTYTEFRSLAFLHIYGICCFVWKRAGGVRAKEMRPC